MELLLQDIKKYIHELLNVDIEASQWKEEGKLTFFLTDAYDFYETSLFNQACLLMIDRQNGNITPGTIRKHQEQIQKNWNGPIIYVQSAISSYNRKRLIEHHIPFIIPGNQMYLPQIGIDFREHFRKTHTKREGILSPSTQAIIIYALLCNVDEELSASILANKLGYTLMTMTRALNELKSARIGEFHQEGRERFWTFSDKKNLWRQAKPLLQNPVKKRLWMKNHRFKYLTGLSALSHFSQLTSPSLPIFAIGPREWRLIKQSEVGEVPSSEGATAELQIWNYDPELFAKDGFVDPISLYCSLRANTDERIELCLEEMMEKLEW